VVACLCLPILGLRAQPGSRLQTYLDTLSPTPEAYFGEDGTRDKTDHTELAPNSQAAMEQACTMLVEMVARSLLSEVDEKTDIEKTGSNIGDLLMELTAQCISMLATRSQRDTPQPQIFSGSFMLARKLLKTVSPTNPMVRPSWSSFLLNPDFC